MLNPRKPGRFYATHPEHFAFPKGKRLMPNVMETLGHSQIELTLNTYSHVLPSLQRDAVDRMHAALSD